jgi:fumarate hydratase class II
VAQIDANIINIENSLAPLYELAIGGTAVGTGLNAHKDFGRLAADYMAKETGSPFITAPNKFYALAAHDALVGMYVYVYIYVCMYKYIYVCIYIYI